MIVVTSAKIRRDIREHLTNIYQDVEFRFHTNIKEAEKDISDANIIISYGEDLNSNHIYQAKNLRWIMVISAGIDQLPFKAIEERGIIVTNAKGIHAIPMGEYAISMMLQTARQTKQVIENEQNKNWDRSVKMTELSGRTIGILGAGAIGQEVARLAKAFNMKVIGLNRSGRDVNNFDHIVTYKDIATLLRESDFIVSVLPKTEETDRLLGKMQFEQMNNDVILINMGRGNVIVEEDLIEAIRGKQIKHAVLDVFNEEPLPENHPFWNEPDITVTPHISGISPQYQPRAFEIFEHNFKVFREGIGKYINFVDSKKGY